MVLTCLLEKCIFCLAIGKNVKLYWGRGGSGGHITKLSFSQPAPFGILYCMLYWQTKNDKLYVVTIAKIRSGYLNSAKNVRKVDLQSFFLCLHLGSMETMVLRYQMVTQQYQRKLGVISAIWSVKGIWLDRKKMVSFMHAQLVISYHHWLPSNMSSIMQYMIIINPNCIRGVVSWAMRRKILWKVPVLKQITFDQ